MTKFSTYLFAAFCALAAATLAPSAARAAVILDISPEGLLLGARNVDVGGTLYDVTFQAGSCAALFNGCDEISDFAFQDRAIAVLAATALSETVLLDSAWGNFDSDPMLTNGCLRSDHCLIYIPYASSGGLASTSGVGNAAPPYLDLDPDIFHVFIPIGEAPSRFPYAVFTPAIAVPEPASALLLGAGLIGWIGLRRRGGRASGGAIAA